MKGVAAAVGVLCLSPLLLAGTAGALVGGASTTSCSVGPAVDIDAVTRQVASILSSTGSDPHVHVEGLDLPAEQIPNAKVIVATGISLHVPPQGQVVAIATALQESRLRNLVYGDRDSLGLFQQRPSQGWGTPEQIRDPVFASTKFYTALLKVSGWQQLTVTQAAQEVQHSAFPDAYAQWEGLARALQKAITAVLPRGGTDTAPSPAAALLRDCEPGEDGSGYGPFPEGTVPEGYTVPKDAPKAVRTALTWAMHQLGTPYQWGGTCTGAHGPDPMGRCDCSSLMQQAYAHAGISLTRTTYTQISEGKPVPLTHLRPGDLLFTRGTPARPEHVGMYMGHGLVINAPRTGRPVRIEPVNDWQILAARRVV
ncbi:C40 family peptidase [Streptomyces sp. NPDC006923]|uniref:C40 family peptidase n=1 Tax=Streptomyces sp. NPDC006923 TaxID=3155355 RepID=UPI003400DC54